MFNYIIISPKNKDLRETYNAKNCRRSTGIFALLEIDDFLQDQRLFIRTLHLNNSVRCKIKCNTKKIIEP